MSPSRIERLIQSGTSTNNPEDINRRIMFSNVIFLVLPTVYLIMILVEYEDFLGVGNAPPFLDFNNKVEASIEFGPYLLSVRKLKDADQAGCTVTAVGEFA